MPISFGEILKQNTPKPDEKKPGEVKRMPMPAPAAPMPSPVPTPVPAPFPARTAAKPAEAVQSAAAQALAQAAPAAEQAPAPAPAPAPAAPAVGGNVSTLRLEVELRKHLGKQIRVYTSDKENVGGKLDMVADGWIRITNARSATSEYYSDEDIIHICNITRIRYSRSITKAEYVEEMNNKNGGQ